MVDPDSGELDEPPSGDFVGLSEVLLAALEQTRAAACITTADLDEPGPRIVYVNPAYCRMTGRTRADVIGRTPRLMQGPLTDRRVLDRLRADLRAGRSFTGETINYRADGTPFVINWSIDPVLDRNGSTTHYIATQQDVTEQVRTAALRAAGRGLDEALTSLLDASVRATDAEQVLADQIVAGAASIAGMGDVVVELEGDEGRRTTRSGSSMRDMAQAEHFDIAPTSSVVRGRILVAGLTADELAFLDQAGLAEFAERAGIAYAALAEYLKQRSTAERLQRSMLPPSRLEVPGFSIATHYAPGELGLEVGGDWYDVVAHGDRVAFTVGDVSGSGVGAAALMGRLRLLAEVELERGAEIEAVLALLDAKCRQIAEMATVAMVEIDGASGAASVWAAGHLPPVIVDRHGIRLVDVAVAPPLGHMKGAPTPTRLEIAPGEGMVMFTDGLVERRGESITLGLDRLVSAIDPHAGVDDLIAQARAGCRPAGGDDMAILAFRRTERTR